MGKYFLGIDLHKEYAFFSLIDKKRKVLFQKRVPLERKTLLQEIEALPQGTQGVVEPLLSWSVLKELFSKKKKKLFACHPLEVKALSSKKRKNDKYDSLRLAELLRVDFLPKVHIPSKNSQRLKSILMTRELLLKMKHQINQRVSSFYLGLMRKPCFERKLPPFYEKQKEILLLILSLIEKKIKEIEKELKKEYSSQRKVKILLSIPGIGLFCALSFLAWIDDEKRFPHQKAISAYSGFAPIIKESGKIKKKGGLSREGNSLLMRNFYLATLHVSQSWGYLYSFYERLRKKKGKKKARVALARKLFCLCWTLLKKKKPFRKDYPFLKKKKEVKARISTGP